MARSWFAKVNMDEYPLLFYVYPIMNYLSLETMRLFLRTSDLILCVWGDGGGSVFIMICSLRDAHISIFLVGAPC